MAVSSGSVAGPGGRDGQARAAAPGAATGHPRVGIGHPLMMGVIASVVGFSSTFTVVLQGFVAIGATPEQAASGLFAICVAMGAIGIGLTLAYRMPISIAWSTPGSVLFASTGLIAGGYSAAAGAFIGAALLVVLAGLVKPFGRLVASIPPVLANAMLAGLLLGLCLAPAKAVATEPGLALPVVIVWALVARFKRLYAVPAAVLVAILVIAWSGPPLAGRIDHLWPDITFVAPTFSIATFISLAVPLFLVTMASQNIPGLAVMRVNGYLPPVRAIFVATGLGSVATALLGGHTLNMSAITAALCAGPEAHPDPRRRWVAVLASGSSYILLGFAATFAALLFAIAPPVLIQAAAGLALLSAFAAAMAGALENPADRDAALVTFVTAASGLSFFGIGSAFWGLVAGGLMMALGRLGR